MKVQRLTLLLLLLGATHSQQQDNQTHQENRGQVLQVVPLGAQGNNASSDVCVLPMVVGSCRAALPRFFFDVTNQSCRSFIYGGCGTNGNNFLSQQECENRCGGLTVAPSVAMLVKEARIEPNDSSNSDDSAALQRLEKSVDPDEERCRAEPDVGPCKAAFQRWFFSRQRGRCESFIYGGCQGNQNNYDSEQSCMTSCSETILPSARQQDVEEDVCSLTSDPGPCRAAFTMFFYNPSTQRCQSFIYGGCQGNMNRFVSEDECLSRCHGGTDRREQNRNHWSAAVFLFVALGVISILILSTIVIITLRRQGLPRRSSSVSDKEELLPDDQTSVDSFNVHEVSSPPPKA